MTDPLPHQETLRLVASVTGQVQGVGFRAYVIDKASLLGLTGWVRNNRAGPVEVLAEGERPALEDLLVYLRRGPRMALVEDVQVQWLPATGEFIQFDIERTV